MSDNTLSEQDAKAYAQWVTMEITNYGSVPIKIKGMYLSWGKLYINGRSTSHDVITHAYQKDLV